MAEQRSIFDVIGPVMIGPSSSHTAGATRLGRLARAVFGQLPKHAEIALHGSFASTGYGHGTDLALIAGLLGCTPDDERILCAYELAEAAGLTVSITEAHLGEVHPNTARFRLSAPGAEMDICGSSLGGGAVCVTDVDHFAVQITGNLPMLLVEHEDRPGQIAGATRILAEDGINVASMQVSREQRGARALMLIETDDEAGAEAVSRIGGISGIISVRVVSAI